MSDLNLNDRDEAWLSRMGAEVYKTEQGYKVIVFVDGYPISAEGQSLTGCVNNLRNKLHDH